MIHRLFISPAVLDDHPPPPAPTVPLCVTVPLETNLFSMFTLRPDSSAASSTPVSMAGEGLEAQAPFGWGLIFTKSLKCRFSRLSPKEVMYTAIVCCLLVSMCPAALKKCSLAQCKYLTPQLWGFVVCLPLDLGLGSLRRRPQDKDSSVFRGVIPGHSSRGVGMQPTQVCYQARHHRGHLGFHPIGEFWEPV